MSRHRQQIGASIIPSKGSVAGFALLLGLPKPATPHLQAQLCALKLNLKLYSNYTLMKTILSALAITAVALSLSSCSSMSACKACCKDKCAECCDSKGKACADCCKK